MKKLELLLVFLSLWLLGCSQPAPENRLEKAAVSIESANAMASLWLDSEAEWNAFREDLRTAAAYGLDAVSVDVWWGKVEAAGDQVFDWSYYDRIAGEIAAAGLEWVPIFSFHRCGGNVGDDCNIPIPNWIWDHYRSQGLSPSDLRYKSEQGNESYEYVSLWADPWVVSEYAEFAAAFALHFQNRAGMILEINVSLGPSGELRYPSYNNHDQGTGYPNRGALQSYSRLAIADFQNFVLQRYGNLAGVNRAWDTKLTSPEQIQPPSDPAGFFGRGDQYITYGKDFFDWYSGALAKHGRKVLEAVAVNLSGPMSRVDIGMKIPGVHWRMGHPSEARSAEMTAGLIPTSVDLSSSASGHGYRPLLQEVKRSSLGQHRLVLHFTALEMGNQNYAPQYSQAEDLVFWVAEAARGVGLAIKGENALAGGVESDFGWDQIENAVTWAGYRGITILRLENVTRNAVGRERFSRFIQNFRSREQVPAFDEAVDTLPTLKGEDSSRAYTSLQWVPGPSAWPPLAL